MYVRMTKDEAKAALESAASTLAHFSAIITQLTTRGDAPPRELLAAQRATEGAAHALTHALADCGDLVAARTLRTRFRCAGACVHRLPAAQEVSVIATTGGVPP